MARDGDHLLDSADTTVWRARSGRFQGAVQRTPPLETAQLGSRAGVPHPQTTQTHHNTPISSLSNKRAMALSKHPCITWFQTQLILATCQTPYHSHLLDHRRTGQL